MWALYRISDDTIHAIAPLFQRSGQFEHDPVGQPNVLFEWRLSENPTLPQEPSWDNFTAEFYVPGGAFYESIRTKVAAANDFTVTDEWQNIKHHITTGRNTANFCQAIAYLAQLLTTAGHPLSADDITGLNTRLTNNNFPLSCQL